MEAGETLGYLIPRLGTGADLGESRVAFERARSALALAKTDVQRLTPLFEQGAIPRRRLDEAPNGQKTPPKCARPARSRDPISALRPPRHPGAPLRVRGVAPTGPGGELRREENARGGKRRSASRFGRAAGGGGAL